MTLAKFRQMAEVKKALRMWNSRQKEEPLPQAESRPYWMEDTAVTHQVAEKSLSRGGREVVGLPGHEGVRLQASAPTGSVAPSTGKA